jgi:hypothetical protein
MRSVAALLLGALAAFGQATTTRPAAATVCEVAGHPDQFAGKIMSIRGLVLLAFEDFSFSAKECQGRKIDDIWLEYGRGPKNQPTTWCCGDLTPRDSLQLIQDKNFRDFHRKLTAHGGKGPYGAREKYLYDVTATLTGRFEIVPAEVRTADNNAQYCLGYGFGHFGLACARLVIQSVSNVVAQPR